MSKSTLNTCLCPNELNIALNILIGVTNCPNNGYYLRRFVAMLSFLYHVYPGLLCICNTHIVLLAGIAVTSAR